MIVRKTTMKQLRERAGLSQNELGKRMNLTTSAISKWDQGIAFPKLYPAATLQLCDVLSCTMDELVEAQRNWEEEQASD